MFDPDMLSTADHCTDRVGQHRRALSATKCLRARSVPIEHAFSYKEHCPWGLPLLWHQLLTKQQNAVGERKIQLDIQAEAEDMNNIDQ